MQKGHNAVFATLSNGNKPTDSTDSPIEIPLFNRVKHSLKIMTAGDEKLDVEKSLHMRACSNIDDLDRYVRSLQLSSSTVLLLDEFMTGDSKFAVIESRYGAMSIDKISRLVAKEIDYLTKRIKQWLADKIPIICLLAKKVC